ncbi:response regulator, partial [Magnetococcales bacterium HHB-1]
EEKLDLIFASGFSSREKITEISGRGVGLDVVRTRVLDINGHIHVESTPDKGTTFHLTLPLTLSTERGLIVRLGEQRFAISSLAVNRTLILEKNRIVHVENRNTVKINHQNIPLADLAETLGLPHQVHSEEDNYQAVVLSNGFQSLVFLVDEVIEEREIVVKPLNPPLYTVKHISGGAVVGSGRVVLVLKHTDLIETAMGQKISDKKSHLSPQQQPKNSPKILVVDDSITTRILETNILKSAGFDVETAVNGREAWKMLKKEQRFDLVISDIQMPLMDGFELTDQIKTSPKTKHIPVIIVSSLAKEEDKQRGIEVGADAYIVKSQFESRTLLDMVEQLLPEKGQGSS